MTMILDKVTTVRAYNKIKTFMDMKCSVLGYENALLAAQLLVESNGLALKRIKELEGIVDTLKLRIKNGKSNH